MNIVNRVPNTVHRSYDTPILLGCAAFALFAMVVIHVAFVGPGSAASDAFVMAAMP